MDLFSYSDPLLFFFFFYLIGNPVYVEVKMSRAIDSVTNNVCMTVDIMFDSVKRKQFSLHCQTYQLGFLVKILPLKVCSHYATIFTGEKSVLAISSDF